MEEVECKDLLKWCEHLEQARGIERAKLVLAFALECMTKKPQSINDLHKLLGKDQFPDERKLKKLIFLKDALRAVANSEAILPISAALDIIRKMPEVVFYRKELYREMLKATRGYDETSGLSLRSTAWKIRDGYRRFGRYIDPRVVSRTALIKGLEFDHVVIVDVDDFNDAKNLYVALTRGTRSLTVTATSRVIQRPAPRLSP